MENSSSAPNKLLFAIDAKDYDPNGKAYIRPSTRCIAVKDGKVALVHSQKRPFGYVHRVQKTLDPNQDAEIFIQDNFYYLCDVADEVGSQEARVLALLLAEGMCG